MPFFFWIMTTKKMSKKSSDFFREIGIILVARSEYFLGWEEECLTILQQWQKKNKKLINKVYQCTIKLSEERGLHT